MLSWLFYSIKCILIMSVYTAVMSLLWHCHIVMNWMLFIILTTWIEWWEEQCLLRVSWLFSSCNKSLFEDRFLYWKEHPYDMWVLSILEAKIRVPTILGQLTSSGMFFESHKCNSVASFVDMLYPLCFQKVFRVMIPESLCSHGFYRDPMYDSISLSFILIEMTYEFLK